MYKILIATHGKMCEGMLDTLHIFSADIDMVTAIPFYTEGVDGDTELETYMKNISKDDIAVALTDIPGGSVNQKLYKYVSDNVHVISGVNFPLLCGLALADEKSITKDFLRGLVEDSRNLMQYMNDIVIEKNEGDE
ncbi:PTS fructose transporter subunit IIA [Clostridium sp. chh4-2]|uniref:PTS sugar transporter subunit IIA domain-containing protein n=1 Tax=Clostridium sp. chh4-2 TaxID=2067550 RepID=UPI0015E1854B|nr:PTS fructose transporter subunit IIA [Clostridium sp. chh4-2]